MWPSAPPFDAIDGQCAASAYLPPDVPLSHPIASPLHAPPAALALLPPLLHIVGGGEVLLLENLLFAQRVAAAGASVTVDVWESMWHDFVEHSEGCGADTPLSEAHEALEVVGAFLRDGARAGGCRAAGGERGAEAGADAHAANINGLGADGLATNGLATDGLGAGAHACVRWHARFNILPRVLNEQCKR